MQNICVFDCEPELKIEYTTDDGSFCIKCTSEYPKLGQDSRLYADFDDGSSFEIALFKKENSLSFVDTRYSLSYLKSQGIEIERLAGYSVYFGNGGMMRAQIAKSHSSCDEYMNDSSVIRAKQLLADIRNYSVADSFIESITSKINRYKSVRIPVLKDFSWHIIDREGEYFGLSSISFFIQGMRNKNAPRPWFFGKCKDDRLYAVLIQTDDAPSLPDMNDCVIRYRDADTHSIYYAVGIMLLDDGQYFCRLA